MLSTVPGTCSQWHVHISLFSKVPILSQNSLSLPGASQLMQPNNPTFNVGVQVCRYCLPNAQAASEAQQSPPCMSVSRPTASRGCAVCQQEQSLLMATALSQQYEHGYHRDRLQATPLRSHTNTPVSALRGRFSGASSALRAAV